MRVLLAFVVALVPGVFSWWTGRQLVRLGDDPLLPERMVERRNRVALVVAFCAGLASVLAPRHALLLYGLTLGAVVVGGFPARKALFDESWSLTGYLAGMGRMHAALFGFWVLLIAAPQLIHGAGSWRWPVAAIVAGVLVTWSVRFPEVFVRIAGAQPLVRPDLAARFAPILAATSIHPPRVLRFGVDGGRLVNAFALASTRGSAVVFTDDVLERFEPDEITAIFAHEVAHLEHHDRRYLMRSAIVEWVLIALAVVAVPLVASWSALTWAPVGWGAAVLLGFTYWRARHQGHEAEADARAAALCGDPALVARALVKLHALGRWPRRWSVDFERAASHPSLARRIQALRAAAGLTAARLTEPVIVASTQPGALLLLEAERACYLSGVKGEIPHDPDRLRANARSVRAVQYCELTQLRVRPTLWGKIMLVATTPSGRSWSFALRPEDVTRVQAALDVVDSQFSTQPPLARPRPVLDRVLVGHALLFAVVVAPIAALAALPAALIALVRPWRAALAAVAAVAAACVGLALPDLVGLDVVAGVRFSNMILLLGVAALLVWRITANIRRSPEPWTAGVKLTLAGLGVVALATTALGLWQGMTWWALGPAAFVATNPNALVATMAFGAALLTRGAWARSFGALTLGVGVAAVLVGGGWIGSPLPEAGPLADLRWTDKRLRLVETVEVEGAADGLRVDPSGRGLAVEFEGDDETARAGRFVARTPAGGWRSIPAADVQFIDERRLLAVTRKGRGLDVSIVDLDRGPARQPVWRASIPNIQHARLIVTGDEWKVIGRDPAVGSMVVASGRLDAPRSVVQQWVVPPGFRGGQIVAPDVAFVARAPEHAPSSAWLSRVAWLGRPGPSGGTELWRLAPTGVHRVGTRPMSIDCPDHLARHGSLVCQGYPGAGRGRVLWRLDTGTSELGPAAFVRGMRSVQARGVDGRLVALGNPNIAMVLDLAQGHAVRAPLPEDSDWPEAAALLGDRLAVLTTGPQKSRIALYAFEDPIPPALSAASRIRP